MRGHIAHEIPDDEPPRLYRIRPAPMITQPVISPGLQRLLWLSSVGIVLGSMVGFLLCFLV